MTDKDGTVIERYAYDPWGARRNPTNWTQKDSRTKWITNRGYTGHEHLDAFGIINMNGRVYDPLTAMFFSPDPYVQAPDNWLNYNRYGYCYGNPLKYTDPSGNTPLLIPALAVGVVTGLVNLFTHLQSGNLTFWQGLGAFGIGFAGGFVGVLTGGAVYTAMGGKTLGAAVVSAGAGYTATTAIQGVGNTVAFGDPLPTAEEYLTGLAFTMITAGVFHEIGNIPVKRPTPTDIPEPLPGKRVGIDVKPVNSKDINLTTTNSTTVRNDMNPAAMEGKVMNTVKGPDGKVTFVFENGTEGGGQGGLNLFKWGSEQTGRPTGWKAGDYMLNLQDKGTPQLNWKANYGSLRSEMNLGNPIFDSYRLPNGNLIPTRGFLNAERFTLLNRGWIYNPVQGAWSPPIK